MSISDSFPTYAAQNIKIQPKKGPLCNFELNSIQADLARHCMYGTKFLHKRVIILKPRQVGSSTFLKFALTLWPATTRSDWRSLIITHKKKLARKFLRDIRLAYDYLPEDKKPDLQDDSVNRISFPELRSSIEVASFETGMKGSGAELGENYQAIYGSELADPRCRDEVIEMIFPAVEQGIFWVDSTPKGRARWFYNTWQAQKQGDSEFVGFFYPWYRHEEEYTSKAPKGFQPEDEEEEDLIALHGLTPGQIVWRRKTIRTIGRERFREQYPENDVDCFLFSGSPCFNQAKLQHMLESPEHAADWPTWRGDLEWDPATYESFRAAQDIQTA